MVCDDANSLVKRTHALFDATNRCKVYVFYFSVVVLSCEMIGVCRQC